MTRKRELPLEDRLLKLDEAAKYFAVEQNTVRRWLDNGHLAGTRTPGGHRRVFLWSVLKALENGAGQRP
jgi:excisionase family DNA binding protein